MPLIKFFDVNSSFYMRNPKNVVMTVKLLWVKPKNACLIIWHCCYLYSTICRRRYRRNAYKSLRLRSGYLHGGISVLNRNSSHNRLRYKGDNWQMSRSYFAAFGSVDFREYCRCVYGRMYVCEDFATKKENRNDCFLEKCSYMYEGWQIDFYVSVRYKGIEFICPIINKKIFFRCNIHYIENYA
jgi:hypothetical protein